MPPPPQTIERSVFFYEVQMRDEAQEWRRADVLRQLAALQGDDRLLDLGQDNFAWVEVDRIPHGNQTGRARFFRDRRSNLPGYQVDFNIDELPIPARAGIIEPTHLVFGGGGVIAAEYNHFAPRVTSAFAQLLRRKLGLDLVIGTYVQRDIIEVLDRLGYINLLEFSIVPSAQAEQALRDSGELATRYAEVMDIEGARRLNVRLSGDRRNPGFTDQVRDLVKRLMANAPEEETKILRVHGYDPASDRIEPVDLLHEKLVRRIDVEKAGARSKVLDTSSAYRHVEDALAEVRTTDLPGARVLVP